MINLTVPIVVKNIQKLAVVSGPDITTGAIQLTAASGGTPAAQVSYSFTLSDVANGSGGLAVNANPNTWNDTITIVSGVGAANSLASAIAAYSNAAGNKTAKLDAILARGVVDGWLTPAFAGA